MQAFGAFSPNKMKFYGFCTYINGYACMRRYIYVQNTKAVGLGEKHQHLPIYPTKRGKIVPLWLRTYFRGGTV